MILVARIITQGALARDECRGAHYKPEFQILAPDADDEKELIQQARQWCEAFRKKNEKWLKTTVAQYRPDEIRLRYDDVDTGSIPPRPRTYGLKGAEIIGEVWKEMSGQPRAEKRAHLGAAGATKA